jgi:Bax protein
MIIGLEGKPHYAKAMKRTLCLVLAGFFAAVFLLILPLGLAWWQVEGLHLPTAADRLARPRATVIPDYSLDAVRRGAPVPRIYLARLPGNLGTLTARERKRRFLAIMLPLVLRVNELIADDRRRLDALSRKITAGEHLRSFERAWLVRLARDYRTEPGDIPALAIRMEAIPPSLVLAQAAIESGWGTSRFARLGNALFGQWSYDGQGLVPARRESGKNHRIRTFPSLMHSVYGYMRNLNTHQAYRRLRIKRLTLIQAGRPGGADLADTLINYSQRGAAYIEDIRLVIRANRLAPLDQARLASWPR